jgi:hypothetical protein
MHIRRARHGCVSIVDCEDFHKCADNNTCGRSCEHCNNPFWIFSQRWTNADCGRRLFTVVSMFSVCASLSDWKDNGMAGLRGSVFP